MVRRRTWIASGELYVLFFALAAGVLISLMAVFNGRLTAEAGLCLTTAIIHVVAIIFALIILWIKNSRCGCIAEAL